MASVFGSDLAEKGRFPQRGKTVLIAESSKASEHGIYKNNSSGVFDYNVMYIKIACCVPSPRYVKCVVIAMHFARPQSVFKAPYLIGGTQPKAIISGTKPHAPL
jgi:hypothetical protein